MSLVNNPFDVLPADWRTALLVGRVHDPDEQGPSVVVVAGDELLDISGAAPTLSQLLDAGEAPRGHPVDQARGEQRRETQHAQKGQRRQRVVPGGGVFGGFAGRDRRQRLGRVPRGGHPGLVQHQHAEHGVEQEHQ